MWKIGKQTYFKKMINAQIHKSQLEFLRCDKVRNNDRTKPRSIWYTKTFTLVSWAARTYVYHFCPSSNIIGSANHSFPSLISTTHAPFTEGLTFGTSINTPPAITGLSTRGKQTVVDWSLAFHRDKVQFFYKVAQPQKKLTTFVGGCTTKEKFRKKMTFKHLQII